MSTTTTTNSIINNSAKLDIPLHTTSTHDYVNKGINELTSEYFKLIDPEQRKTIKSLFMGLGILITADIGKTLIQNFIKEHQTVINSGIMTTINAISFQNIKCGIGFIKKSITNVFSGLINIFKYNKYPKDLTPTLFCDDKKIIIFKLDGKDTILINLIKIIDNANENNINPDNFMVSYTELIHEDLTLKNDEIIYKKTLNNICIKFKSSVNDKYTNFIIYNATYNKKLTNGVNIVSNVSLNTCPTHECLPFFTIEHLPKEYYEIIFTYFTNECSLVSINNIIKLKLKCIGSEDKGIMIYNYHELFFSNIVDKNKFAINGDMYTHCYDFISFAIYFMLFHLSYDEQINYLKNTILNKKMNIFIANAIYIAILIDIVLNNQSNNQVFIQNNKLFCINVNSFFKKLWDEIHEEEMSLHKFINAKTVFKLNDLTLQYNGNHLYDSIHKKSFVNILKISTDYKIDANDKYLSGNKFIYYFSHLDINSINNNTTSLGQLELIIDNSETNYNKVEALNKVNEFLTWIKNSSKKQNTNKKISIYTITIEKKEEIEKTVNTEYTEYINMKNELLKNKENTEETILKLLGKPPIQNIDTTKIIKNVVPVSINNKYASFDNLYLQKRQDEYLYNIVDTFHNDKQLMKELGIPNKLGILLHGEPGCGKTTTIITIASYFGRDIFYINLKSISTNDELKMVFDYINKTHIGGGIVVLEDIDAMTNIVNKRNNLPENNYTEITTTGLIDTETHNLTLEYLLNLMDGTLTYNDSIVIITTNHIEKLDPAIYRAGRIDNLIEMKKCDHYQICKIYKRFIQREISQEVLTKIPENKYTPAEIIFYLKQWVKKRQTNDETIMSNFIA